jgi:hypothetical protein
VVEVDTGGGDAGASGDERGAVSISKSGNNRRGGKERESMCLSVILMLIRGGINKNCRS